MPTNKNIVRNSSLIALPQQFVTVQIHNNTDKKKFRSHRESIFNQMKNTQDLLQQTLNKNLRHPKSKFTPNFKIQTPTSLTTRKLIADLESNPSQKRFEMRTQINRKLKQLCNISHHFQQACEYRKKIVPTFQYENQINYSLPVVSPHVQSLQQKKIKEEIIEHRTMVKDWKFKVKQGREFVKKIKLKNPLKFKDLNSFIQTDQQKQNKKAPSLKSLRDIYFSQIRQQRKTVPTNSNNLQLLFCQQKLKKNTLGYVGDIEKQPALKLQQFLEGGQQKSFNQYSDYLNINQFKRSKQKSNILDKVYNYVKRNNQFQFKDMNIDHFQDKNLLSVAYYIENQNNMTESQKKQFKRKLKIID